MAKGYKVSAKFGKDTIKFELPIGVPQETLNEAWMSARKIGAEAFGFKLQGMICPETLEVMVQEYYED